MPPLSGNQKTGRTLRSSDRNCSEKRMDKSLPVYLAGCMAGISQISPQAAVSTSESEDADLDWDFIVY